jgi:magnesium transporter
MTIASSPPSGPAFRNALAAGDMERAGRVAAAMGRAELSRALLAVGPAELESLYTGLGDELLAELIRQLRTTDAAALLRRLRDEPLADVLDELPPDDAADVLEAIKAIEPARVESILVEMDRAGDIEELLAFLPDTAGGRMTSDVLSVRTNVTAEEAIDVVRARTRARGSAFRTYLYVVDDERRLLGVVPLYRLVMEDPTTRVAAFMVTDPITVRGTDDQHQVVRIFRERHFLAVPVVDLEGRLIGAITADDVTDVLDEETTSDMYHMAGVGVTERATSPVLESARRRVPWLTFNMIWSLGSGVVISVFQPTIEQAAVLVVFIPVIAGQAGNAGIQTATIVIRSLALGDVTPRDTLSVLMREWGVGLIQGRHLRDDALPSRSSGRATSCWASSRASPCS